MHFGARQFKLQVTKYYLVNKKKNSILCNAYDKSKYKMPTAHLKKQSFVYLES